MTRLIGIFSFYLLCQFSISAQNLLLDPKLNKNIDSLASLVALDTLFDSRHEMIHELESLFLDSLFDPEKKYIFNFEYLNTLTSTDGNLTLISGFYTKASGVPDYFLFYQYCGEPYSEGSILTSVGTEFSDPDMVELREDEWFGAIYYQIHDFKLSKDEYLYMLFGANLYKGFEHRKIVEPIYFENGKIKFGFPIFKMEDETKLRSHYIIQYSRDSAPILKYDKDQNLIVFDHLMPAPSLYDRNIMTMVPDGTYEAFKMKNNIWQHIVNLPLEKLAEPPNINRQRNNSKDILGREN